jgi:hypothetical protein
MFLRLALGGRGRRILLVVKGFPKRVLNRTWTSVKSYDAPTQNRHLVFLKALSTI